MCKDKSVILSSPNGYLKNDQIFEKVHTDITYDLSTLDINQDGSPELEITFAGINRFEQIRDIEKNTPLFYGYNFEIDKIQEVMSQCNSHVEEYLEVLAFIDIDGDKDFDLLGYFMRDSNYIAVYCENTGSSDSPIFISMTELPEFLSDVTLPLPPSSFPPPITQAGRFMMGDLDGDQDLYVSSKFRWKSKFYDNIGTIEEPVFKHISHIPFLYLSVSSSEGWLDLDHDGRVESAVQSGVILNKGLEPATDIKVKVKVYDAEKLIVAVNRPSQVQIYNCFF